MINYTITVDAWDTIIAFHQAEERAPDMVGAITERNARNLLGIIQRLSPFQTGEYRASHRIELRKNGMAYMAEVGSDLARGMSLEFGGEYMTPSGGTATRPPKPHFRPAFEVVSKEYFDELYMYITP